MKYLIFFLMSYAVVSTTWANDIVFSKPHQQIANKGGYFCAIDMDGLKCWEANERLSFRKDYLDRMPLLKNPQQVVMSLDQVCALDDEGVKCWGGEWEYPKFNHPTQITLTDNLLCSTAAEGVKCAGGNTQNQNFWETVKNPRQVVTGGSGITNVVVCILDSQEVHCWKYDSDRQKLKPINGPDLRNPRKISVGWQICAIDDDGVKCWGIPEEKNLMSLTEQNIYITNPLYVKPGIVAADLKNPLQVTSGDLNCVLEATGVKCWNTQSADLIPLPLLKNPFQVVSSRGSETCAYDDEGLKCWNVKGETVGKVPPLNLISINILKKSAGPARAQYLTPMDVLSLRSDRSLQENFFLWALISPAILSSDSKYQLEKLIPAYQQRLNNIGAVLSYESKHAGLSKTPDTTIARTIALESIRSALSVANNFLSNDQQVSVQNALRACGNAAAEPMNNQDIQELVRQIDGLVTEKQLLSGSVRSAFLVDTIELAADWLREKVK